MGKDCTYSVVSTVSKLVPSEVCHIRFTTPNPATPAHKIYPHQLHRKNRKKKQEVI